MTKQEFGIFASALRTYYPKEQLLPNQQAMELWYREVQDIPAQIAEAALRKWVQTNKWSPSIADLRALVAEVSNEEIPDWSDGWSQVQAAIRRYGFYSQKEALESMDELTRQTVRRMGFTSLCMSENETADRANFRTIYETLVKREKTMMQVALPLQDTIKQIQANGLMQIGSGESHD